jgi:hypothetical protein
MEWDLRCCSGETWVDIDLCQASPPNGRGTRVIQIEDKWANLHWNCSSMAMFRGLRRVFMSR